MSSMLCMPSPSEAYIYICVQYCTVISHKALSIYKLVLTSYEWDASVMGQTIKNGVDGIMHVGNPILIHMYHADMAVVGSLMKSVYSV